MSGEHDYYIPRRLDDPGKLLFWEYDIAMIVVIGAVVGIFSADIIILLVSVTISVLMASAYGRLKAGRHPGMAKHIIYWFFGLPKFKVTPPSHYREMIG